MWSCCSKRYNGNLSIDYAIRVKYSMQKQEEYLNFITSLTFWNMPTLACYWHLVGFFWYAFSK